MYLIIRKKGAGEMDKKPDLIVENSNEIILNDISAYLQYLRDNIKRIIEVDGLQYSEPMDKKKIYPAFTYNQFLYLLQRLYDCVFSVNLELLYDNYINKYNKNYNIKKVELCYEVYNRLCLYYGFVCSLEGFYLISGIDKDTLHDWLSCGRSQLLKKALENSKNALVSGFENSQVPILRLAAGNYKYKLQTPQNDRTEAAAVDVLPDLLQLTGSSQQALSTNNNLIVPESDTIQNDIKTP